jgi:hypothetical protein
MTTRSHPEPERWGDLFGDLEAQLEQSERAEQSAEVADRTRRELAAVSLADRLRAGLGLRLLLQVRGVGQVSGALEDAGPGWALLLDAGREVLVSTTAVSWVSGLPARASGPLAPQSVAGRVSLGMVLRGLVRERALVRVAFVDGGMESGTFDRVGADWVELAVHEPGTPRRADAVRALRVVPFDALACVRPER